MSLFQIIRHVYEHRVRVIIFRVVAALEGLFFLAAVVPMASGMTRSP
jgi:hypothetical protein